MKQIKIIKWFVLGLLLILSGYYMIVVSTLKGILMLLLVLIGIYLLDIRQIERYLDVILRRIYVCVDFETAEKMRTELEETLMIPFFKREVNQVIQKLMDYLAGDFKSASAIKPARDFGVARLNLWDNFVKANLAFEQAGKLSEKDLEEIKTYYRKIKKPLGIEACMMERLELKKGAMTEKEWLALRAEEQSNLQFAELHYCLGQLTSDQGKRDYYFKIAANLAPETYYGRRTKTDGTNISDH